MPEQRRPGKYPAELRERAVRMVFECERDANSQWDAICLVAEKLGPTAETVRKWLRRAEIDEGHRPELTTDERQRLKELERENRELRRANEISKAASTTTRTGPVGTQYSSGALTWRLALRSDWCAERRSGSMCGARFRGFGWNSFQAASFRRV